LRHHLLTLSAPAQRGYEPDWLGNTFSIAVFLGNGLVAIVAGLLAHGLVEVRRLDAASRSFSDLGSARLGCTRKLRQWNTRS